MTFRLTIILPLLILVLNPLWAHEKPARTFTETKVMSDETRLVVQLLENVHYKNEQMEQDAFETLLTDFMAQLDTHRLFFLDSDQNFFLKTYGSTLGEDLREKGSLEAPFRIYATYHVRAAQRVDWILQQLDGHFSFSDDGTHIVQRTPSEEVEANPDPVQLWAIDFDEEESYVFDRSEEPWPANMEESDNLWRQRIKFELLEELLTEKDIDEARENIQKRYTRLAKSLDEFAEPEIQEAFLSTLARMYDPHSTYFSADTLEDFSISMRLSLVGIGALLSQEDGYCVVRELIPGGPASLSKQIKPNDKIVGVAQGDDESVDVIGMSLRKIVKMIRGEKGSPVRLTIQPGDGLDSSLRSEVTLMRDVVQLNASRTKADIIEVPGNEKTLSIGVIDIPSFYGPVDEGDVDESEQRSVTQDVEELVSKLDEAGVDGIVLDLRENGGGLLSEAVDMTGLFIRQGPVVQVRDSNGQIYIKPDLDPKVSYDGPLMVLTSRFSASASEIVAGALQNYGRALIIGGSSTHGKGTVQAVLEMKTFIPRRFFEDSQKTGAAKLTVQKFYLPNGFSTQNKGVIPDVALPSLEDYLPIGESDLPHAMAWDTIRPARFTGFTMHPDLLTDLQGQSLARQETLEEFAFLQRRIEWFKQKQEMEAISLNLDARQAQKLIDETFRDEMDAEQTVLAEANYASTEVLLEAVLKDQVSKDETEEEEEITADAEIDEDDENPLPPPFDIHLRESLRIMADAIEFSRNPTEWVEIETLTAQRGPVPTETVR